MPAAERLIIAGAGIAGLTCALALGQRGRTIQLLDQAQQAPQDGAGLQLGPNVTRHLRSLGILENVMAFACRPTAIRIRRLKDHKTLGRLPLGQAAENKYGSPYLTMHRADLLKILLQANAQYGHSPAWGTRVEHTRQTTTEVQVRTQSGQILRAEGLIGADGIWSRVRLAIPQALANPARPTGQIAFRGLIPAEVVVDPNLMQEITVWTRPGLHLVGYPIQSGARYNLVALCPTPDNWQTASQGWSQPLPDALLSSVKSQTCPEVMELMNASTAWHAWAMHANQPLSSAQAMVMGRVFLVGDAAHPLRPHLAQGAAMGIEDAVCLARWIDRSDLSLPEKLASAADERWLRNANVQRRSAQNGNIFQLKPPWVWGRDIALKLVGRRLMDQKWLYQDTPQTE